MARRLEVPLTAGSMVWEFLSRVEGLSGPRGVGQGASKGSKVETLERLTGGFPIHPAVWTRTAARSEASTAAVQPESVAPGAGDP